MYVYVYIYVTYMHRGREREYSTKHERERGCASFKAKAFCEVQYKQQVGQIHGRSGCARIAAGFLLLKMRI